MVIGLIENACRRQETWQALVYVNAFSAESSCRP